MVKTFLTIKIDVFRSEKLSNYPKVVFNGTETQTVLFIFSFSHIVGL